MADNPRTLADQLDCLQSIAINLRKLLNLLALIAERMLGIRKEEWE